MKINNLMSSWSSHIKGASCIFIRTPKYSRGLLIGGEKDGKTPFVRGDPRLRDLPFPTRRPTLKEVVAAHDRLATIFVGLGGLGGGEDVDQPRRLGSEAATGKGEGLPVCVGVEAVMGKGEGLLVCGGGGEDTSRVGAETLNSVDVGSVSTSNPDTTDPSTADFNQDESQGDSHADASKTSKANKRRRKGRKKPSGTAGEGMWSYVCGFVVIREIISPGILVTPGYTSDSWYTSDSSSILVTPILVTLGVVTVY